jgi:hypothetical protein
MAMGYGCLANDGITVPVGAVELECETIILNAVNAPPRGVEREMENATLRTPKNSGFRGHFRDGKWWLCHSRTGLKNGTIRVPNWSPSPALRVTANWTDPPVSNGIQTIPLVSRFSGYYCLENPSLLEKEADA